MKAMKYLIGCSAILFLLSACEKDEGPSVDDYFLNYEIPEIPVTEDYQVGIFYHRASDMDGWPNGDANFTRWELLTKLAEELPANYNKLTPQLMPESQQEGFMKPDAGSQSFRMIPMIQQHVDDCIEAGADFMILPEVGIDINQGPGTRFSRNDSLFVTLMLGHSGRSGNTLPMPHLGQPGRDFVDLKTMKIVVALNWNAIVDLSPQLSRTNCIETAAGKEYKGVKYTRQELLNNYFCEIARAYFSDESYYRVGGTRPMVYIRNKTAEMYAQDSKAMYDSIRKAVKDATGEEIYIVAESADVWCNQMRFQYFYMNGAVDAVASRNMYDQSELTRSYMYPQMIDQNWKYNRETALPAFGGNMEYIPTVGPGWNKLVQDGRGSISNSPIVQRDSATYSTLCNVAKMNAGRNRLILIDSYNRYNFDSFIEPTVEGYGNGYGDLYLRITRQQFKMN
jgi:hypothetical protein